ncbi:putative adhesin [Streptomyces sp. WAC06614]|uniref:putative adhesin n=1 Tax=Streptomyces sp. WAC06614 TaxID=2487416 RepID=UPI000F79895E|nr:hypothetical protein [Streptomyces sp. WAC06614]RSS81169.1 hypothetical protein EF918_11280 [Streptomyces sp. WAC06614]
MPGLIVSGHASWTPGTVPPHATLHPGQEVHLYQEVLHLVPESLTLRLEQLAPELLANPVRRFRDRCPNFTVYPPEGVDKLVRFEATAEYAQLVPDEEMTLAEIVARYPGHTIHWGACAGVDLKEVGGQAIGVNLGWDGNQNGTGYVSGAGLAHDAEKYRDRIEAVGADFEHWRPTFEFQALMEAAFPVGAVAMSFRVFVAPLWELRAHGPQRLARCFAGEDCIGPEARRGLLLNDVLRHWLEDIGIYTRDGWFNDRMLMISVPEFWLATGVPADDEARELFLYSDLPTDSAEAFAALRGLCAGAHDIGQALAAVTPEQRRALLHDAHIRQWIDALGYVEESDEGHCTLL